MVACKVNFTPKGREGLGRLDKAVAQRILEKIRWLSQNVNNIHPTPLKGKYTEVCKLRVGDWRVLYTIGSEEKLLSEPFSKKSYSIEKVITIHLVKHRREIYRF
ncbi:MAG TPA: type II toxin-antitoxin system RelE family toxin [Candidatus Hypogeohydataceae bacterium YC41]